MVVATSGDKAALAACACTGPCTTNALTVRLRPGQQCTAALDKPHLLYLLLLHLPHPSRCICCLALLNPFCCICLVDAGADVNKVQAAGTCPCNTVLKCIVLAAVSASVIDLVQLVDAGADVNEVEAAGNTPLHSAAFEGWLEGAQLLLQLGAKINASNNAGDTPWVSLCTELMSPHATNPGRLSNWRHHRVT
jgi:hypothetical protein